MKNIIKTSLGLASVSVSLLISGCAGGMASHFDIRNDVPIQRAPIAKANPSPNFAPVPSPKALPVATASAPANKIAGSFDAGDTPHNLMIKPVAVGVLTSGHGYRISPTGEPVPRKHKGVDYAAPVGTEVFAAGDGVIEKRYNSKSYGNYIRIRHDNGFSTAYAHLHSFSRGMKEGTTVKRGQVIGKVGSTGRSTGPHLHFELIHDGDFIDPLFDHKQETLANTRSFQPAS